MTLELRLRRTRGLVAACVLIVGCAPPRPSVGGKPVAPSTQASYWTPPSGEIPTARSATPASANLQSLTLADVVDLSLKNNPATRLSWSQALAAADEYGAVRGALLPSVSVDYTASKSLALAGPFRPAGERTQYGPGISLSYMLLDFGGRAGRIDVARKTAVAASLTHDVVIQNTILLTESAVFTYLGTRALRDAQRTVVEEAKTNLAAAQDRHEVGLATIADVLQAQTALSQATLALESLDGSLDVARASVAVSVGLPAASNVDIPDVPAT
ncbi:MAG TPA: TolC family protein, partial [Gemmatimonadaceae bacterium]